MRDAGHTVFQGPTVTCLGNGPIAGRTRLARNYATCRLCDDERGCDATDRLLLPPSRSPAQSVPGDSTEGYEAMQHPFKKEQP